MVGRRRSVPNGQLFNVSLHSGFKSHVHLTEKQMLFSSSLSIGFQMMTLYLQTLSPISPSHIKSLTIDENALPFMSLFSHSNG